MPTADILLKCPECSKCLAIDPRAIGKDFRCPDCEALVHVRSPSFCFQCQACKTGLYAAENLAGEAFDCPACRQALTVPAESCVFCWNCGVGLSMDRDTLASLSGRAARCPQCGKSVDIPDVPRL
jgi:hypothetical protein